MKALVFPGQGSQHPGMGQSLYENSAVARKLFDTADDILGFDITKLMFEGSEDDLKRTAVTQPAIYVHSVAAAIANELGRDAALVAGHSLGEFSALVAAGALNFEDGLRLVSIRANAMQKACDLAESTMAAILGMEDAAVEQVCKDAQGMVVPANYNTKGQVVISGEVKAVWDAMEIARNRGAFRAIALKVSGGFHSPFMEPARRELAEGIESVNFEDARIPVYQNVSAEAHTDKEVIKKNLLMQLVSPVRWTQTIIHMIEAGTTEFVEVGPGKVLRGLIKKIDRRMPISGVE